MNAGNTSQHGLALDMAAAQLKIVTLQSTVAFPFPSKTCSHFVEKMNDHTILFQVTSLSVLRSFMGWCLSRLPKVRRASFCYSERFLMYAQFYHITSSITSGYIQSGVPLASLLWRKKIMQFQGLMKLIVPYAGTERIYALEFCWVVNLSSLRGGKNLFHVSQRRLLPRNFWQTEAIYLSN